MRRVHGAWLLVAAVLVLSACGPTRKSVFPPLVSVQQLRVDTNGQWHMQLRIQNNSFQGVKFTSVQLDMHMHDTVAGHIDKSVSLDIPALSVDIADVEMTPSAAAAKLLDSGAGSVSYKLDGTISGKPDQNGKSRKFKVHGQQYWLSPTPGLTDTWR